MSKKKGRLLKGILVLVVVALFAGTIGKHLLHRLAPKVAPDTLRTMLAYNYSIVSPNTIMSYNDVHVLESEYQNIFNNINMEEINKDEEMRLVFLRLMDAITFYRKQEGDRDIMQEEYKFKAENAIFNNLPSLGTIVSGSGGNPYAMAAIALQQVGSSYFNYRREIKRIKLSKKKQDWELKKGAMEELNEVNKEFFSAAWSLYERLEIPDEWRLTQPQVEHFVKACKEEDPVARLAQFDHLEIDYQAYPPFYYHYGKTLQELAHATGNTDPKKTERHRKRARQAYARYKKISRPILREDPFLSAVCMNEIGLLPKTERSTRSKLLKVVLSNSRYDMSMIQYVTLQYLMMGEFEKAEQHLRTLIAYHFNERMNKRLLTDALVGQDAHQKLSALATELVKDENAKHVDTLYLVGRARDETILQRIAPDIAKIAVNASEAKEGTEFRLSIPCRWVLEEMTNSLAVLDNRVDFAVSAESHSLDQGTVHQTVSLPVEYVALVGRGAGLEVELVLRGAGQNYTLVFGGEADSLTAKAVVLGASRYELVDGLFRSPQKQPAESMGPSAEMAIRKIIEASRIKGIEGVKDLSAEEMKEVRKLLRVPPDDRVLGVFNTTLIGNMKDGIVFTDRRICWRRKGDGVGTIEYDRMNDAPLTKFGKDNIRLPDRQSICLLPRTDEMIEFLTQIGNVAGTSDL